MIVDLPLVENVVAVFDDEVLVVARGGGQIHILKKELGISRDMIKGKLLKFRLIIDLIVDLLDELKVKGFVRLIGNQ